MADERAAVLATKRRRLIFLLAMSIPPLSCLLGRPLLVLA
jgi:hypothetical protein